MKLLATPRRVDCELCGRVELKGYTPYTPVCMACAMEDKAQGHQQEEQSVTSDEKYSVRFRPFEPSK